MFAAVATMSMDETTTTEMTKTEKTVEKPAKAPRKY
tara:strand:- start:1322 stop:1429 length:108 start_codon:yes stop_codon:yes gene_type:complete